MSTDNGQTDAAGASGGTGHPDYGSSADSDSGGAGRGGGDRGADDGVERLRRETATARILLQIYQEVVADDQEAHDTLIEGETDFHSAAAVVLDKIAETMTMLSAIKGRIDALKARQDRYDAYQDRLRAALQDAMASVDIKTVKLPDATISRLLGRPKVLITDEAAIPVTYQVPQPPKIDKIAITAALKHGAIVAGARFDTPTEQITIRWK